MGTQAVETAALWKPVEKSESDFPTGSHSSHSLYYWSTTGLLLVYINEKRKAKLRREISRELEKNLDIQTST
jgi:hypothetical protein